MTSKRLAYLKMRAQGCSYCRGLGCATCGLAFPQPDEVLAEAVAEVERLHESRADVVRRYVSATDELERLTGWLKLAGKNECAAGYCKAFTAVSRADYCASCQARLALAGEPVPS